MSTNAERIAQICAITQQVAEELLRVHGEVEMAISQFFENSEQGSNVAVAEPNDKLDLLRGILGEASETEIRTLLQRTNDVGAAVEEYFANNGPCSAKSTAKKDTQPPSTSKKKRKKEVVDLVELSGNPVEAVVQDGIATQPSSSQGAGPSTPAQAQVLSTIQKDSEHSEPDTEQAENFTGPLEWCSFKKTPFVEMEASLPLGNFRDSDGRLRVPHEREVPTEPAAPTREACSVKLASLYFEATFHQGWGGVLGTNEPKRFPWTGSCWNVRQDFHPFDPFPTTPDNSFHIAYVGGSSELDGRSFRGSFLDVEREDISAPFAKVLQALTLFRTKIGSIKAKKVISITVEKVKRKAAEVASTTGEKSKAESRRTTKRAGGDKAHAAGSSHSKKRKEKESPKKIKRRTYKMSIHLCDGLFDKGNELVDQLTSSDTDVDSTRVPHHFRDLLTLMESLLPESVDSSLALGPDSDEYLNLCDKNIEKTEIEKEGGNPFDLQHTLAAVELPLDAAAASVPPGLQSLPKPYQLQGLQWLLQRERRGAPELTLHPCWMQLVAADGQVVYVHRISGLLSTRFVPTPVGGTCGGFLCDEMGLGKTLEMLMLILANPAPAGWAATWDGGPTPPSELAEEEPGGALAIKTTLVVSPESILQQWAQEIRGHVGAGALRVGIYDGRQKCCAAEAALEEGGEAGADGRRAKRRCRADAGEKEKKEKEAADGTETRTVAPVMCRLVGEDFDADGGADAARVSIHECDLVLMSYETLRQEMGGMRRGPGEGPPLLQFGFWRVVLDEAQLVASSSSVAAQIASELWRRHAWVVTGTPISSRLDEMKGLLHFLAHPVLSDNKVWHRLIQTQFEKRQAAGMVRLRLLLRQVLLRRTKANIPPEQMGLPPCSACDIEVTLSGAERAFYDRTHRDFSSSYAAYKRNSGARRKRQEQGLDLHNLAARVCGRLLAELTRLRQACCHPQIVRRSDSLLGEHRLGLKDILRRMVERAQTDVENADREHLHARALHAAALDAAAGAPGRALEALLDEVQARWMQARAQERGKGQASEGGPGAGAEEGKRGSRGASTSADVVRAWRRMELSVTEMLAYVQEHTMQEGADGASREDLACQQEGVMGTMQRMQELRGELNIAAPAERRVKLSREAKRGKQRDGAAGGAAAAETEGAEALLHGGLAGGMTAIRNLLGERNPEQSSERGVERALRGLEEKQRVLRHIEGRLQQHYQQCEAQAAQGAAEPAAERDGAAGAAGSKEGAEEDDELQDDAGSCPICFDELAEGNRSVTKCAHLFCSACIHSMIPDDGEGPCPICRTMLTLEDVYDASAEAEAEGMSEAAVQVR
ncbi:hypothetical protein CYMTET_23569 [Cymbomonas tetramitiformis]|uniref:RING-type domain-containing protein n=1 Tax=Cymbomonas tetramitiformis TaxID=36881 RepID=A0AAE0FXQ3_9CHLO|nr:hypothetical protein CYMTET_23569 [Cymbomonas tetramitiformis]